MDPRTGMPVVGMIGGGQLARMTHQAAIALGQSLRVLADSPADAAALITPDVTVGSHHDLDVLTAFAETCDVVTFDHEHVPTEHIRALIAAGHPVFPTADALQYAQDKALMRDRLRDLGIPVPRYRVLAPGWTPVSARAAVERLGSSASVVIKAACGGYDGRGVWICHHPAEVDQALAGLASEAELLLEERVELRRELAAVVARSPFGQAAGWPVVETVQEAGICVQVVAPAPGLPEERAEAAEQLALRIAGALDVVGVLAVELFEVPPSADAPEGLLVNELAMRPHNSAHWTQDGALTSQFEQHLRAVLDYPLGRTDALAPFTVMGNVLGGPGEGPGAGITLDERVHHLAARFPEAKVHLYGKSYRPGRKLGHVNLLGGDLGDLRRKAALAAGWLGSGVWADGYSIHGDASTAAPPASAPAAAGDQDVS